MISTRLEELLGLYKTQVDSIEILEEQLKEEKEALHKLVYEIIPDVLAEIGSNEIKVGERWIRMRQFISAKISDERYDEALNWIEESGYGAIKTNCIIPLDGKEEMDELNSKLDGWTRIYERKIHHRTLEAAVRKLVQKDISIPQDLIAVSMGNYAKID